jgi:predicted amidohydrolase YtcJ
MLADGSGGARTAWLHEDWNKEFEESDVGNRGYPRLPPEVLKRQIRLYHEAGLHIGVHAIGDRAIDFVVDNYAANLERTPTVGLRHSLIHGNIPTDRALEVLARLQRDYDAGYPEIQSTFMWWIGDTYAGNFGHQRARRLKPLATFVERGIRFSGGSDFGVTPFAPRYGLWASMTRETLNGVYGQQPFGTDEAIDIRTALKSYTVWSAPQLFMEDEIGTLEVGKYADLVVWDTDLYTATPEAIKEMRALMTMVEGEIVYRDKDF